MTDTAKTNPSLVARLVDNQPPSLVQKNIPIPSPGTGQVLVKISHAAQNPTDVKSLDRNAYGEGAVLGCDFVGDVVEIGDGVSLLGKGDIVGGLIRGGEIKGLGAFSTYTLAEEHFCFKLPTKVSRESASTIPLAATTAWLGLFSRQSLGLDRSGVSDPGFGFKGRRREGSLLVWGGGSSVGSYAIQLASIYGFNVVTTCSLRHEALVRSYGASHVFDYRDEGVAEKIKAAVPDLRYVFDTIGSATSSAVASRALSKSEGEGDVGGRLCTVLPGKGNTKDVVPGTEIRDVFVWGAFLRDTRFKTQTGELFWPASKEEHDLASELFENLPTWLAEGRFKTNMPKVLGGMVSVSQGFQEQREGKISGYKIVYRF
ncbi:putative zinc-binding dehydrogenase family oxidoreductase [Aspergillus cavernicola]|uniref:Zinc-binding dehydrogenase family oxidoreductase n=1 Tax=Aspergillus cavernicola TaxID=176166 RepID=A0ABR4I4Q8_9EURO